MNLQMSLPEQPSASAPDASPFHAELRAHRHRLDRLKQIVKERCADERGCVAWITVREAARAMRTTQDQIIGMVEDTAGDPDGFIDLVGSTLQADMYLEWVSYAHA